MQKRLLIAAIKSGSGKTIFTCGLLELLKQRYASEKPEGGLFPVVAHKCGPDYIDPMFHKKVLGVNGTNLDPFFSDKEDLVKTILADQANITIIEGAMGVYDGITGMGKSGSCYDVAQKTETPIILVVNSKGMGATVVSVLKGILADDEAGLIKGVIFNRMSPSYLEMLMPEIKGMLSGIKKGVSVLGAIPDKPGIGFESRHLGLIMPDEIADVEEKIKKFSELIKENIDIDRLIGIAEQASLLNEGEILNDIGLSHHADEEPVLAVARDEAFCFYYEQNIRSFEEGGVKIVYFSPLTDKKLPDGISGLLLGGGYPELFLKELSENTDMRDEIKKAIEAGLPSLAECGGFMYLHEYIEQDKKRYPMVGVVSGVSYKTPRLGHFGYITVSPVKEGLLRSDIRGHEFHYYDSTNSGCDCRAKKPGNGKIWDCMHMGAEHLWGYPHLYYPSDKEFVDSFIKAMEKYAKN